LPVACDLPDPNCCTTALGSITKLRGRKWNSQAVQWAAGAEPGLRYIMRVESSVPWRVLQRARTRLGVSMPRRLRPSDASRRKLRPPLFLRYRCCWCGKHRWQINKWPSYHSVSFRGQIQKTVVSTTVAIAIVGRFVPRTLHLTNHRASHNCDRKKCDYNSLVKLAPVFVYVRRGISCIMQRSRRVEGWILLLWWNESDQIFLRYNTNVSYALGTYW